jgi:hypothetical protein
MLQHRADMLALPMAEEMILAGTAEARWPLLDDVAPGRILRRGHQITPMPIQELARTDHSRLNCRLACAHLYTSLSRKDT